MTQDGAEFPAETRAALQRRKYSDQMKRLLKMQLNIGPDLMRLPVDSSGFH